MLNDPGKGNVKFCVLRCLLHGRRNLSSERLNNKPQVTKFPNGRDRMKTLVGLLPGSLLF